MSRLKITPGLLLFILTGIFHLLMVTQATGSGTSPASVPWYSAWYLWIGLGICMIVLVSIAGTEKKRD